MSIYLGVDAGGSKTHALLVDENGTILGKGSAGNGNHQLGREVAEHNIRAACEEALQQAGITKEDVTFAYFGLAGADREPDYVILRPMIAGLGFKQHALACDTMIGMRAGTKRAYGAVIICGSGFNSAARNSQGEELQYGGFGFKYGDGYGGGSTLAMLVFRAVIRAWDGRGEATALTTLVLQAMNYTTVEALYNDVLDHRVMIPRDLVKTLFVAANQGDEVAKRILQEEGAELGNAVCALIKRLHMTEESFDIVLIGSVVTRGSGPYLIDAIQQRISQAAPHAQIVRLEADPVVGAVMSAMDHAGYTIDAELDERLKSFQFEKVEA
ncbi:N-acetylglucosamine kinase [Paenibacillus sp. 481]|uniref:N-acetylglucosamine kinase n=1 Tax=Paenibacillus sp. 481 TaxID=2835869 RepID=UPI001E2CDDC5|nr:BadF/BadG/BcrA/BcrD ATPase family protein [Paenibacillus sp. 481]UHA72550.1 ATPase [Paenibacillus sp. 481]